MALVLTASARPASRPMALSFMWMSPVGGVIVGGCPCVPDGMPETSVSGDYAQGLRTETIVDIRNRRLVVGDCLPDFVHQILADSGFHVGSGRGQGRLPLAALCVGEHVDLRFAGGANVLLRRVVLLVANGVGVVCDRGRGVCNLVADVRWPSLPVFPVVHRDIAQIALSAFSKLRWHSLHALSI